MKRRLGVEGDITLFHTIVRTGSFAAAARILKMTPSGVSRRVKSLEERLGTQLLRRTTRSLSLTESGDLFADKCAKISADIREAESLVATAAEHSVGIIRVGTSAAIMERVIQPHLDGFVEHFPDVDIHFVYGGKHLSVSRDRLDVLFVASPVYETSVISTKLFETPWITCAAKSYLEKHGQPDEPEDLLNHDCLVPVNLAGEYIDRWAYSTGDRQRVIRVHPRFVAIGVNLLPLALRGLGIARLPAHLVSEDIARGSLTQLLQKFPDAEDRALYMVCPRTEYRPTRSSAFIDHMYRCITERKRGV